MRSAWWCYDCHQKIESCYEGGGCHSIADLALPQQAGGEDRLASGGASGMRAR